MGSDFCVVCGGKQFHKLYEIEGNRQIISCKCGHQSIYPVPSQEELQRIYGKEYYDFWGVKDNFQQMFNLKLKTCEMLIKKVSMLVTKSNNKCHLDIGCAFGYMIKAAQSAGYKSQGLEISPAADEGIKLGFDIRKISFEDADFPGVFFDLLTAVDVIEHISEPKIWLKECLRVIRKGGILLLVTPNCSSLPAIIRKNKWPHYKIEHLHYYSPLTIKRLLTDIGFTEIRVKVGIRYLTLNYITNHYNKFQSKTFESKLLKVIKNFSPKWIFEYPLPFPSEMVVTAKKI